MIRLKIQAQKHVLVVARVKGLESLSDVGEEHLPILRTMHDVGLKWAQTFLKENESLVFRLGYHSVCGAFISFYYNFFLKMRCILIPIVVGLFVLGAFNETTTPSCNKSRF